MRDAPQAFRSLQLAEALPQSNGSNSAVVAQQSSPNRCPDGLESAQQQRPAQSFKPTRSLIRGATQSCAAADKHGPVCRFEWQLKQLQAYRAAMPAGEKLILVVAVNAMEKGDEVPLEWLSYLDSIRNEVKVIVMATPTGRLADKDLVKVPAPPPPVAAQPPVLMHRHVRAKGGDTRFTSHSRPNITGN